MGHLVAGRALRPAHLSQEPGVHRGCGGDARPGHRRQHRHLHRRQRRALSRPVRARRARARVDLADGPGRAGSRRRRTTFSTSEYFAYRDRAQTLSGLAAFANAQGEATLGGDTPRKILGMLVSCNYFAVLQQPPALGRALAAQRLRAGRGSRRRAQSRAVADGVCGGPRDRGAHHSN